MMTLNLVMPNEEFEIVKVYGGRGIVRKVSDMGLTCNNVYKVVNNSGKGPVIIERDGVRIGIGYGMANKIFVKLINKGG